MQERALLIPKTEEVQRIHFAWAFVPSMRFPNAFGFAMTLPKFAEAHFSIAF